MLETFENDDKRSLRNSSRVQSTEKYDCFLWLRCGVICKLFEFDLLNI